MSQGLNSLPAYLGSYAAMLLALVCNSYLDIEYGEFGIEVGVWAIVFAVTLAIGWLQQGEEKPYGKIIRNVVIAIALIATLKIFLPVFGVPRTGVYLLAGLQAANNCVTTTRQRFYLSLLVSLVLVLFATNHFRADWSMLFYLLPYLVALVFALVAEQVSQRIREIGRAAGAQTALSGQGAAIAAATVAILFLATLLYSLTPQINMHYLKWRFGLQTPNMQGYQDGTAGRLPGRVMRQDHTAGDGSDIPDAGEIANLGPGSGSGSSKAQGNKEGAHGGSGNERKDGPRLWQYLPKGLPSPDEMRDKAAEDGMPKWQAEAIHRLAGAAERAGNLTKPVMQSIGDHVAKLSEEVERLIKAIQDSSIWLILLGLMALLWMMGRRLRIGLRAGVNFDYMWLGILGRHAGGAVGARQYFLALGRILSLRNVGHRPNDNTREYLAQIARCFARLRSVIAELILLYERSRFSARPDDAFIPPRMRALYRVAFCKLK